MLCLKCGRETENEQAFWLECQKEMAKYPVDPNTVVHIPVQQKNSSKKPVKRRLVPEEQIRLLKRRSRVLTGLLLACLIALVCLSIPLIRGVQSRRFQIGQNYTTIKPAATTSQEITPEK